MEAPSASSSKKGFIKTLISNPDFGKCYVAVAKIKNGTLVPVKLKAY